MPIATAYAWLCFGPLLIIFFFHSKVFPLNLSIGSHALVAIKEVTLSKHQSGAQWVMTNTYQAVKKWVSRVFSWRLTELEDFSKIWRSSFLDLLKIWRFHYFVIFFPDISCLLVRPKIWRQHNLNLTIQSMLLCDRSPIYVIRHSFRYSVWHRSEIFGWKDHLIWVLQITSQYLIIGIADTRSCEIT